MNPLLVTIFACVALGVVAARVGDRVYGIVPIVAVLLTAIYLFLPRYM
jgi:hypothetical protein